MQWLSSLWRNAFVPHKMFGPIPFLSLPLLHCHGVTSASGLKSTPTKWDTPSRTLHNQPFKLRQHSGSRNLTIFLYGKIFAAKVDIDSDRISKNCAPRIFFLIFTLNLFSPNTSLYRALSLKVSGQPKPEREHTKRRRRATWKGRRVKWAWPFVWWGP